MAKTDERQQLLNPAWKLPPIFLVVYDLDGRQLTIEIRADSKEEAAAHAKHLLINATSEKLTLKSTKFKDRPEAINGFVRMPTSKFERRLCLLCGKPVLKGEPCWYDSIHKKTYCRKCGDRITGYETNS